MFLKDSANVLQRFCNISTFDGHPERDHKRLDMDHSDQKLKLMTFESLAASDDHFFFHLLLLSIYKTTLLLCYFFWFNTLTKLKQKKKTKLKEIKSKMFFQCALKDCFQLEIQTTQILFLFNAQPKFKSWMDSFAYIPFLFWGYPWISYFANLYFALNGNRRKD